MSKTVEGALRFFNLHCCKVSKQVYRKCKKGPCASKPKKAIVYVCMAQVIEGLVEKVREVSIRCKLQSFLAVSVTVP